MGGSTDDDDEEQSVGSSTSLLSQKKGSGSSSTTTTKKVPKCHCSWKNCRNWQKTFRDFDHSVWNGAVGISWGNGNNKLKKKWDKCLKVAEAKRLGKRYFVARHHFPEKMILQYLEQGDDTFDWTKLLRKGEAEFYYGLLPYSATAGDDMYYKLPLVPKENVKEIVRGIRKEMSARESISSTVSAPESPSSESVTRLAAAPIAPVPNLSPARRGGGRGADDDDGGPRRPGAPITSPDTMSMSPRRSQGASMAPPSRPGINDDGGGGMSLVPPSGGMSMVAPSGGMSMAPTPRPGLEQEENDDDGDSDSDDEPLFQLQKSHQLRPDQIRQLHGDDVGTSERSMSSHRSSTRRGEDEDTPIVPPMHRPSTELQEPVAAIVPPPIRARRRPTTGITSISSLKVKDDISKQEQIRNIIAEEEMGASLQDIRASVSGLQTEDRNDPMHMSFPAGGGGRKQRTSRHGEEEDRGARQRPTGRGRGGGRGGMGPGGRGVPKKPSRNVSSGLTVANTLRVKDDVQKQEKIHQIEEEERLSESRRGMIEQEETGFTRNIGRRNVSEGLDVTSPLRVRDDVQKQHKISQIQEEEASRVARLWLGEEEEEKKDFGEMMQISVHDYQALLKERDELRETTQKQAASIEDLNKNIRTLKSEINEYIECDEDKNDKLEDLEDKMSRVASVKGLDVAKLTEGEIEDPLAAIELLKVENERLNKKASYLAQRGKTHEATIKELEKNLAEVCYGAIEREKELQELLVKDPWEQITSALWTGWGRKPVPPVPIEMPAETGSEDITFDLGEEKDTTILEETKDTKVLDMVV